MTRMLKKLADSQLFADKLTVFLFTQGSQQQVKCVKKQIDHFKNTYNVVFNFNHINSQMKLALAVNLIFLYITYYLLTCQIQTSQVWMINYLWLVMMSVLNITLIIPKILLFIMLYFVKKHTIAVDDLIENTVSFFESKVFIFNNKISVFIIYGYILSGVIFTINTIFEHPSLSEISNRIFFLQLLLLGRIVFSFCFNEKEEKGLSQAQINQTVKKQSYIMSADEQKQVTDCCSICVEDFKVNENVIKLECKHLFHTKCIQEWFPIQFKCPNCNQYMVKTL